MKNEAATRSQLIDTQLARAGWSVGSRRVVEEFLIHPGPLFQESRLVNVGTNEFADYVLLDRLDRPLAIVEAKCSIRDALEGESRHAAPGNRLCGCFEAAALRRHRRSRDPLPAKGPP